MLSHCTRVPAAGGQEVGRYHGSMPSRTGGWHLLLPLTSHGKRRIEERGESGRRKQGRTGNKEKVKIAQRKADCKGGRRGRTGRGQKTDK